MNAYPSQNDFYGASNVAAKYCRLPFAAPVRTGLWAHGWTPDSSNINFHGVCGTADDPRDDWTYWVARPSEASAVARWGVKKVRAIGLPIVYVKKPVVARATGTLVVMPVHTLDWNAPESYSGVNYADQICDIRHNFERVIVVIHPSCIRNGLWVDGFRKRGFEVVPGFDYTDKSSLERMARLLSWAGFVTTNSLGSILVYSALFGARVSIFGTYPVVRPEDFSRDPSCQRNPGLAEIWADECSEARMRREFPWLFVEPHQAIERRSWAEHEAGVPVKLGPEELRREFGWTTQQLLKEAPGCGFEFGRRLTQSAWHRGPGRVQRAIRRRLSPTLVQSTPPV